MAGCSGSWRGWEGHEAGRTSLPTRKDQGEDERRRVGEGSLVLPRYLPCLAPERGGHARGGVGGHLDAIAVAKAVLRPQQRQKISCPTQALTRVQNWCDVFPSTAPAMRSSGRFTQPGSRAAAAHSHPRVVRGEAVKSPPAGLQIGPPPPSRSCRDRGSCRSDPPVSS